MWDNIPHNQYESKAALLEYRQHCNYARIKCKNRPTEDDLRCCLSLEEWDTYRKRETHRNRAKRMRDARLEQAIARYERMGKVQRTIDELRGLVPDLIREDLDYLFETTELNEFPFFSRVKRIEERGPYIVELLTKYFHRNVSDYTRAEIVMASSGSYPVRDAEVGMISSVLPQFEVSKLYVGIRDSLNEDLLLLLVMSR